MNVNRLEAKARSEARKTLQAYTHFKNLNKGDREELLNDLSRVIKNRLQEKAPRPATPPPLVTAAQSPPPPTDQIVQRIHAMLTELQYLIGTLQPTFPPSDSLKQTTLIGPFQTDAEALANEKGRARRKIAA